MKPAHPAARRLLLCALAGACVAAEAQAPVVHLLQPTFATASLPEAPQVAANARDHALYAWNATGAVRFADRLPDGRWTASSGLPGAATASASPAVALGPGDLAAIAYTTVATRYEPSRMMVALRPAGGSFGAAVEVVPGTAAGSLNLAIDCAGSVTLLYGTAAGLSAVTLAGPGAAAGSCSGQPGSDGWSAPAALSAPGAGAALPVLAVNDRGDTLAAWQQGAPAFPRAIVAAFRPAGADWQPAETVSPPAAASTWNPAAGIDATGAAAIGYLDGRTMVVGRRPAGGTWQPTEAVSGAQEVRYPVLAVAPGGEVLAAWQAADASGQTSIWQSTATASGWSAATRLSTRADSPDWPSVALTGDGLAAVVTWTDDTTLGARAALRRAGVWTRHTLGGAYWAARVPVAGGGASVAAGWARPVGGNPNAAQLVGAGWR